MLKETIVIKLDSEGQRVDKFLATSYPDYSRSFLQKLIENKEVLVNKKPVKANYRLEVGDSLEIVFPEEEKIEILPEDIPLDIVYEDEYLLVVNKEAGMIVYPAKDNERHSLVNALLFHTDSKLSKMDSIRPGIVHRLDKDTSGLLVIAKNDSIHESLVAEFKANRVERKYLALVEGVVNEPGGIVDAPIGRSDKDRTKMAVKLSNAKKAVTKYFTLERFKEHSLLECQLETGRTHQIRVHMSYLNHPLVGDLIYGKKDKLFDFNGQALHSAEISFLHPISKERMHFSKEVPEKFKKALEYLREE